MLTFLRWTGRVLIVLLVALFGAVGWFLANFEDWRKQRLQALDAGSKVVETAAGPVEYTESGAGPVVLVSHGAPGGYDQAALIGAELARAGFRVIAPSRPGFLRTPLATGLLIEDQADALAALLDALGVERAAVLGFLTGAPVAVQFALRHPDRTTALALLSPVTRPYLHDQQKDSAPLLTETALFRTTGDIGSWLLLRAAADRPRDAIGAVLALDTTLDAKARESLAGTIAEDPAQLAFFRNLLATQAPLSPRESGTRNDLLMTRTLPDLPYGEIAAPTFIAVGANDAAAAWVSAAAIADKLPGAVIRPVRDAGTLVWFGPDGATVQDELRAFLQNPPAPAPVPTPAPAPAGSPVP